MTALPTAAALLHPLPEPAEPPSVGSTPSGGPGDWQSPVWTVGVSRRRRPRPAESAQGASVVPLRSASPPANHGADLEVDHGADLEVDHGADLEVDHELEVMVGAESRRPAHDRGDLEKLRSAGLVRRGSDRRDTGVEGSLPVGVALRHLLPAGGLRRGSTVAVAGSQTSLLFALLAEASAAGSWCAAVGLPQLGLVAAAEAGVAVDRLALVPYPGPEWTNVVGALIDGFDIVVAGTPTGVPAQLASRLAARARQRGSVLVPFGQWPGADVTLEVVHGAWQGLGQGRGRLRSRQVEVVVRGRGAAARPRRAHLWLPGPTGAPAPLRPTLIPLPTDPAVPAPGARIDQGQRRAS